MQDNKNNETKPLSEEEMLKSLKNSAYLLESIMVQKFRQMYFSVETNQVIKDSFTGKSREIDIIAETYHYEANTAKLNLAVKITFVCEVKNNLYPVILMTPYTNSLNGNEESGLKLANTGQAHEQGNISDTFYSLSARNYSELGSKTFTQYCSFQRKKENKELMALHPEEFYSGLSKITQYCEENVEFWDRIEIYKTSPSDNYNRSFLFLPVVIIKDNLMELTIDGGKNQILNPVPYSRLMFTYHYKETAKSALVYFVTQSGFDAFVEELLAVRAKAEQFLINKVTSPIS